jgi:L-threonylcarbamoyladenylate synthase
MALELLLEKDADPDIVAEAIMAGALVIAPTDTIYALTADATNDAAVAKVYLAKKRLEGLPLPILIRDIEHAEEFAVFTDKAKQLAEKFWPGALTLVLPLKAGSRISQVALCSEGSIALRSPNHKFFQQLLQKTRLPLVGTSANISGYENSGTIYSMVAEFKQYVRYAIASEQDGAFNPIASTIIDCRSEDLKILRQGAVSVMVKSKN